MLEQITMDINVAPFLHRTNTICEIIYDEWLELVCRMGLIKFPDKAVGGKKKKSQEAERIRSFLEKEFFPMTARCTPFRL